MVDTTLNNQMVAVFKDAYLLPLNNPYTMYVKKTTIDIINHLYKNYAHISATYMEENKEKIQSPYNPKYSLESLIKSLNERAELVLA